MKIEITPRPKHLISAIAIGLVGIGVLIFLSVIR